MNTRLYNGVRDCVKHLANCVSVAVIVVVASLVVVVVIAIVVVAVVVVVVVVVVVKHVRNTGRVRISAAGVSLHNSLP